MADARPRGASAFRYGIQGHIWPGLEGARPFRGSGMDARIFSSGMGMWDSEFRWIIKVLALFPGLSTVETCWAE